MAVGEHPGKGSLHDCFPGDVTAGIMFSGSLAASYFIYDVYL